MWHVMAIVTHHRDLFLSLGKRCLHSTIGGMLHLATTILQKLVYLFVQIEISLKNYLFFLRQDADADFHFCLFI